MAARKLHLEVASPEGALVSEDVDDVQAPALDGYIGILPGHAPLLTELGAGVLTFTQEGVKRHIALVAGFLEAQPHRVRVLASSASWVDTVEVERARVILQRASDVLSEHDMEAEVEDAEAAVAAAKAKLEQWEKSRG
jgi:F-type H+-transporting ATPase subunit epsilon